MVEIFIAGAGRCGGKLCRGEGLPVYHINQHTGEKTFSVDSIMLQFI